MKAKGTGLMALGLVLVLGAALLAGYNLYESDRAAEASVQVVQALKVRLPAPEEQTQITVDETEELTPPAAEEMLPDYVRFPEMEMPVTALDGVDYVGLIEIPGLELSLPVIDEWSYEALKIAPCRYEGSAYQGDMIVIAHNYDSHFGGIKNLRPEDVVTFTDMDGNRFSYRVVELVTLPGTAVEEMSAGDWDLTLFTCTYGGQSRVAVRCEQI